MAVRRHRARLEFAGAALCRRRPRHPPAERGLADERAALCRRRAGRLCDERWLVAVAEEVHRARASSRAVVRTGYVARDGNHRRASPQARQRPGRQETVLRSAEEEGVKAYDVIIVGGGHNGLACAAYLSRAGRKVLVLERNDRVGGAAMSEEVFPGFRFSVFSYVVSLLRPEIIRELELARHGLHILPLESTLTPLLDGPMSGSYLAQWSDHDQNRRELARHSPR